MLTAVKQHASAIPYSYGSEKERWCSLDHPSVAAILTNLGSVLSDARTQWINTFWDPNIDEAAQAYPWKLYEDRYSVAAKEKPRTPTVFRQGKIKAAFRDLKLPFLNFLGQLSQDQRSATNNASESMRT